MAKLPSDIIYSTKFQFKILELGNETVKVNICIVLEYTACKTFSLPVLRSCGTWEYERTKLSKTRGVHNKADAKVE